MTKLGSSLAGKTIAAAISAGSPALLVRELVEETGIDPGTVSCVSQPPVYMEDGRVVS